MQPRTLIRLGAIAGVLYTALTIGVQIYGSSVPPIGTNSKLSNEQNDGIFLAWVGHHLDFYNVYATSAITGYVLLGVVALAMYVLLRRPGVRMPIAALCVGLVGSAVSTIAALLERLDYVGKSQEYAGAHTKAAIHTVVKAFESNASRDYGVDMGGHLAIAFWVGLVGATLLPILGRRSVAVWGSLGACLLAGIGIPFILPLWSVGAGFGLWRMSSTSLVQDPAPATVVEAQAWAADPEPTTRRPRRAPKASLEATNDEPLTPDLPDVPVEAPEPIAPSTVKLEPPTPSAGRPPRGTSVPRQMPGHAKGSKASKPAKRR